MSDTEAFDLNYVQRKVAEAKPYGKRSSKRYLLFIMVRTKKYTLPLKTMLRKVSYKDQFEIW